MDKEKTYSKIELHLLHAFVHAQFKLLKDKHEASENNVEMQCLAFTCNVLVDILDEIKEILEPTSDKKV